MRPRVLVLVTLAEVGGAQTYVAQLVPALVADYDVTVAAWGPGPLRAAVEAAGASYVPLRWVQRELHPWRDLRGLVELVVLCRRLRPAVVHANSSKAGVLGRAAATVAGVPVRLFTAHGWAFKAAAGAASTAYLWADRAMRPLTTATICVAESELRAGLAARTCDAATTHVIPNAIDVETAPRAPLAGDPPLVVTVGRFKLPKDPGTLVEALGRLEPGSFRAELVGDGPDRSAAERLAARLSVDAAFPGERHDVRDRLADADVFVLSSRSEGMPLSILEAMAAGLPVVASAVGGVPELVVDGETGLLVPPADPEALAAALRALLDDPERRKRLGRAARERAEARFGILRFREAHLAVYREALVGRGLP